MAICEITDSLPSARGLELRIEALDKLILEQEAYLAQLRMRAVRLRQDLKLAKRSGA